MVPLFRNDTIADVSADVQPSSSLSSAFRLLKSNGAHHARDGRWRHRPDPHVDAFAIARGCALQVPVGHGIDRLRNPRVRGALGPIDDDLRRGDELLGGSPEFRRAWRRWIVVHAVPSYLTPLYSAPCARPSTPSLLALLTLAGASGAAQTAQPPLSADTPSTTVAGATFIAPAGWSVAVKGPATIVEAPEGDSRIALVDVKAADADAAVAAAWAAYRPDAKWPFKSKSPSADKDGWQDQWTYLYQISPDQRRDVVAGTLRHGDQWTVWIYDMSQPTGEKRLAQVELIFGRLLPKGYQRETFAGRKAHPLDAARIQEIGAFVERAQKALGVPGVSIGLVQGGKVVLPAASACGSWGSRRRWMATRST